MKRYIILMFPTLLCTPQLTSADTWTETIYDCKGTQMDCTTYTHPNLCKERGGKPTGAGGCYPSGYGDCECKSSTNMEKPKKKTSKPTAKK